MARGYKLRVLLWSVFIQVLLPILVMFGCGWLLDRRCHLHLDTLVKLNIHLFVPAFIFHEVVGSKLDAALAARVFGFTLSIILAMLVISAVVGQMLGYQREETRALQLGTMFYNSGNYGIPLMALAYPAVGPGLQVFIILAQNISTFTIGLLLASSARVRGWRAVLPMLRQLSLWAVTAGLLVRTFDWPVKEVRWLWVPLEYFTHALVGLALVTLGAQMSKVTVRPNFTRIGWAVGLRLLGGPLLACALVGVFGFRGETARIMILSAAFPTAVNTALIAHEFKADAQFAASAVFYSTLASMLTVTLLIAALRLPQVATFF
jgi:predicted permease